MHVDRLVHGLRSRPGKPLDSTLAESPGNSVEIILFALSDVLADSVLADSVVNAPAFGEVVPIGGGDSR